MECPSGWCWSWGVGGDPGDENAGGVVGEVVAGERVDEVGVAGDMGGGDRDDLAVAGRRRHRRGVVEQIGRIRREQGSGHQGRHVVAGSGLIDDAGHGGGVSDRELVDQVVGVCGHRGSVDWGADTALTREAGRTLR